MGYIIPIFDDSYLTHRTVVAPYLRSKGVTGGFAMVPGNHTGNNANYMSVQQAREIQDVYGHECYTHACTVVDHDNASLFTNTDGYQGGKVSAVRAKAQMVAQGLTVNDSHQIYVDPPASPLYGDTNNGQAVNTVLADLFECRRTFRSGVPATNGESIETTPPMNLYHIRGNGWSATGTTVANVRDLISRCRTNPYAAGVLVFHNVVASPTGVNISPTDFNSVVDEIAFQRDNNYQSDLSAGTAAGKLLVGTLSQLARGQLAPTA